MQTAVLVTGRFSGFHVGHAKLISQAYNKYVATNIIDLLVIGVVVSPSSKRTYDNYNEIVTELETLKDITDKKDPLLKRKKELIKMLEPLKKNPFDFAKREAVIQKFINKMPNIDNNKVVVKAFDNGHIPTIKETLKEEEINIKVLFCGEDRLETYGKQSDKIDNETIDFAVDYINRDLNDKTSGSGTQIRKALIEDNYEEFTSLMPEEFDEELIKEVYDIYRASLKEKGLISSSNSLLTGITHIEDLDIDDFLFWLENLYSDNIELIQKLDGTFNMSVVRTNEGIHFARLAKKQENSFTASSLPKNPLYNALRGACNALEDNRIQQVFIDSLLPNEALDIEVLYGIQPNTIKYNLDANYLAVLRFIRTNKDRIEQNETIQTIVNKLKTINVKINNTVYYYDWDKESLSSNLEEETWKFTTPQVYNKEKLKSKNISFEDDIKMIVNWMNAESSISSISNKDALDIKLIGLKKDTKELYKETREVAKEEFRQLKLNVKTKIAENILSDLEFDLGGKVQEGLVVKDVEDPSKLTKFVDREGFTKENRRNWHYMEQINDVILKDFFAFVSDKLQLPSLNQRNPFFKKLSEASNKQQFIINFLNEDLNNLSSKLILIKNEIDRAKIEIKKLVKEAKQDEILSDTFKKRTLNSLGAAYDQFNELKNKINNFDDNDIDINLAIDLVISLFEIFSSRASEEV